MGRTRAQREAQKKATAAAAAKKNTTRTPTPTPTPAPTPTPTPTPTNNEPVTPPPRSPSALRGARSSKIHDLPPNPPRFTTTPSTGKRSIDEVSFPARQSTKKGRKRVRTVSPSRPPPDSPTLPDPSSPATTTQDDDDSRATAERFSRDLRGQSPWDDYILEGVQREARELAIRVAQLKRQKASRASRETSEATHTPTDDTTEPANGIADPPEDEFDPFDGGEENFGTDGGEGTSSGGGGEGGEGGDSGDGGDGGEGGEGDEGDDTTEKSDSEDEDDETTVTNSDLPSKYRPANLGDYERGILRAAGIETTADEAKHLREDFRYFRYTSLNHKNEKSKKEEKQLKELRRKFQKKKKMESLNSTQKTEMGFTEPAGSKLYHRLRTEIGAHLWSEGIVSTDRITNWDRLSAERQNELIEWVLAHPIMGYVRAGELWDRWEDRFEGLQRDLRPPIPRQSPLYAVHRHIACLIIDCIKKYKESILAVEKAAIGAGIDIERRHKREKDKAAQRKKAKKEEKEAKTKSVIEKLLSTHNESTPSADTHTLRFVVFQPDNADDWTSHGTDANNPNEPNPLLRTFVGQIPRVGMQIDDVRHAVGRKVNGEIRRLQGVFASHDAAGPPIKIPIEDDNDLRMWLEGNAGMPTPWTMYVVMSRSGADTPMVGGAEYLYE